MLRFRDGPPRTSRTQSVTLRPSDFNDRDTLLSGMPNLVGLAVFPVLHFATPVAWNPHKLQLPDCVFRLLVIEEVEEFHPENSALSILGTIRFLEVLDIRTKSPETCRLFTAAVMQICASGESCVHRLDLSCHEGSIDDHTQNCIIEDLRLVVPGLTEAGLVVKCANLAMRVIEEVLPLGKSLTTLKIECSTPEALWSLMLSKVFQVLREFHLILAFSDGFPLEDMDRLAEAIRSHSSLRCIIMEGHFGADRRLVEAIFATPTIVHVRYVDRSFTMSYFLERITPEKVVYPRNIHYWDSQEDGLLLRVFPRIPSLLGWFNKGMGMHDRAMEIVSPVDLGMFATALQNPACSLRNICAVVAPKLESSAEGFFAALKAATSLRSLSLSVLPSAAPVVDVLLGNQYLKEFGWISDLDFSGGGQHEALIDAAVANETIEAYYFQPAHWLWSCVAMRNMTLCVKRIRLLWMSWVSEWVGHGRFEPALIFETIQMADLGWSEADRLKHQHADERDIRKNIKEFKKPCRSLRGGRTGSSEEKCCCS